jgi:hypothetical protein
MRRTAAQSLRENSGAVRAGSNLFEISKEDS